MTRTDHPKFLDALRGVYALYRADLSTQVAIIWLRAMEAYDLEAVVDALTRHALNPDSGQFLPKPADVVRMMGGTTKDAAIIAWNKVDRAVRGVGGYATVVFDDPLIHRVVEELGGWIWLNAQTNDEWPFLEKRFCDHYRVYKARGEVPDYPPKLGGVTDLENLSRGYPAMLPVLVGDPWVCARLMDGGAKRIALGPQSVGEIAKKAIAA